MSDDWQRNFFKQETEKMKRSLSPMTTEGLTDKEYDCRVKLNDDGETEPYLFLPEDGVLSVKLDSDKNVPINDVFLEAHQLRHSTTSWDGCLRDIALFENCLHSAASSAGYDSQNHPVPFPIPSFLRRIQVCDYAVQVNFDGRTIPYFTLDSIGQECIETEKGKIVLQSLLSFTENLRGRPDSSDDHIRAAAAAAAPAAAAAAYASGWKGTNLDKAIANRADTFAAAKAAAEMRKSGYISGSGASGNDAASIKSDRSGGGGSKFGSGAAAGSKFGSIPAPGPVPTSAPSPAPVLVPTSAPSPAPAPVPASSSSLPSPAPVLVPTSAPSPAPAPVPVSSGAAGGASASTAASASASASNAGGASAGGADGISTRTQLAEAMSKRAMQLIDNLTNSKRQKKQTGGTKSKKQKRRTSTNKKNKKQKTQNTKHKTKIYKNHY
jgi:hypothetical protein